MTYSVFLMFAMLLVSGCVRNNGEADFVSQPGGNTLYTETKAIDVYANNREQALQIIDSAKMAGNLTSSRADLLRATVYSRTHDSPRFDSAVVIGERLLNDGSVTDDLEFRQNVLEILVYSTRQLEDYELELDYCIRLADAYSLQEKRVEALRTEAELGAVLCRLGRTDDGMARMDRVISLLTPVRRFNEMDAGIIAMKRKIGVMRDYPQIASVAQRILDCLEDYGHHYSDFHDGSIREPADENRPDYIAFYRAQAWAYLSAAYAHIGSEHKTESSESDSALKKARYFLALTEQSDFGRTLAGKKMIAPTLCLLGEYRKMEDIYQELEPVFMERGDTLTLDYAQLFFDRAKAAEGQGRINESIALWQKHAEILQKAEERLLRGKANLYAARYHAYEQQAAINRQQAELSRKRVINTMLAVGLAVLLAFMGYALLQQRILKRKNSVLAREISEAIRYRDKYIALTTPHQTTGKTVQELENSARLSDGQLFQYIRMVIVRDELFLDPMLNRQKLMECFSLSKERIGAAFSKGSSYRSITDFINDCRLPYAAKLLIERPDLTIAEVSEASGFARAATFTANFKKKFTLTPNQYREQNLN